MSACAEFLRQISRRDLTSTPTYTCMAGSNMPSCFLWHLAPAGFDATIATLATIVGSENTPAINERTRGLCRLLLDFDFKEPAANKRAEEDRLEAMIELATVLRDEAVAHFHAIDDDAVAVLRSPRNNYRIYMPGFVWADKYAVTTLMGLVRCKMPGSEALKALDLAPTLCRNMRVHGTDNRGNGSGVYSVAWPAALRSMLVTLRPNEQQWRRAADGKFAFPTSFVARGFVMREPDLDGWAPMTVDELSRRLFGQRHAFVKYACEQMLCIATDGGERSALVVRLDDDTAAVYEYRDGKWYNEVLRAQMSGAEYYAHVSVQKLTEWRPQTIEEVERLPLHLFVYSGGLSQVQRVGNKLQCVPGSVRTTKENIGYAEIVKQMVRIDGGDVRVVDVDVVSTASVDASAGLNFTDAFQDKVDWLCAEPFVSKAAVTVEAPCGCGKTTFVISLLQRLRQRPGATVLYVAPRASLCAAVHAKLSALPEVDHNGNVVEGSVERCFLYSDGEDPGTASIVVTTFESLVKVVGAPLRRDFTFVVFDESETSVPALFTQPTFDGNGRREKAIAATLAIAARARAVLFIDKDITLSTRMFIGLYMATFYCTRRAAQKFVVQSLRMTGDTNVIYHQLDDEARLVQWAKGELEAGKKIAIFEPSVKWAVALHAALKDCGSVHLVHGKSDNKDEFCADPDAYLVKYNVDALIYTTAIGVGVSVDGVNIAEASQEQPDAFFDNIAVVPRGFLSAQAVAQGERRVRRSAADSGVGQRHLYVVKQRLRSDLWKLRSPDTVTDAFRNFERSLAGEKRQLEDYAFLGARSLMTAGLELRKSSLSVVAAALWGSSNLATGIHGTVRDHVMFDNKSGLFRDTQKSTKAERRDLKRLRDGSDEVLAEDAPLKAGDGERKKRVKLNKHSAIGISGSDLHDGGLYTNKDYMAHGFVNKANARRMLAFCMPPDEAAEVDAAAEIDAVPFRQLDDSEGVGVATELKLLRPVLAALGIGGAEQLWGEDKQANMEPELEIEALLELRKKLAQGNAGRYGAVLDLRKSASSFAVARKLVNAYFGAPLVGEARKDKGAINRTAACVLLECLPRLQTSLAVQRDLPESAKEVVKKATELCTELYRQ